MRNFILVTLLATCLLLGCTEKDKDGHNKTLGDYIIEDLMDD